jgi:hypothetical protein
MFSMLCICDEKRSKVNNFYYAVIANWYILVSFDRVLRNIQKSPLKQTLF